jgi:hypothetical protein
VVQLNVAITGGFPLTIAINRSNWNRCRFYDIFSATANTINTITAADASGLTSQNGAI